MAITPPLCLQLRGITKRYSANVANNAIDLEIGQRQIHALLGENGAGKSTLVKIIYGVIAPDEGEILWQGKPVRIPSPRAARSLGIGMVFQHFSLFESLTVAENISLGLDDPPPLRELVASLREVSERYGMAVDPHRHVHHLSVGERQRIEILRCLLQNPKLLILDEPTSVLTPQEADNLAVMLRRLAAEGCSILYISHKLEEVTALCEAATVLRGGRRVAACDPREVTPTALAEMMVGSTLPECRRAITTEFGPVCLEAKSLSLPSDEPFGTALKDISIALRRGEILGIAGVAGNGQKELLAALSGERQVTPAATIAIDGKACGDLGPIGRRRLGLSFIPEERLGRGAVAELSLSDNLLLTAEGARREKDAVVTRGFISPAALRRRATAIIARLKVKASGSEALASSLSGGNMQKFIVGREMGAAPLVLLAAHPTWGVDIGAALAIRQAIMDLASSGAGVLIVSEDLGELFEITDSISVLSEGRLSRPTPTRLTGIEEIGRLMGGMQDGMQDGETPLAA
jgi:ABC-type uncharacterized transport system ATPase subunit